MMVRMKYIGEERKKAILDFFFVPNTPYIVYIWAGHCHFSL